MTLQDRFQIRSHPEFQVDGNFGRDTVQAQTSTNCALQVLGQSSDQSRERARASQRSQGWGGRADCYRKEALTTLRCVGFARKPRAQGPRPGLQLCEDTCFARSVWWSPLMRLGLGQSSPPPGSLPDPQAVSVPPWDSQGSSVWFYLTGLPRSLHTAGAESSQGHISMLPSLGGYGWGSPHARGLGRPQDLSTITQVQLGLGPGQVDWEACGLCHRQQGPCQPTGIY